MAQVSDKNTQSKKYRLFVPIKILYFLSRVFLKSIPNVLTQIKNTENTTVAYVLIKNMVNVLYIRIFLNYLRKLNFSFWSNTIFCKKNLLAGSLENEWNTTTYHEMRKVISELFKTAKINPRLIVTLAPNSDNKSSGDSCLRGFKKVKLEIFYLARKSKSLCKWNFKSFIWSSQMIFIQKRK